MCKYPAVSFATMARIHGAGYRQMATLHTKPNRRLQRLFCMYTKPRSGQGLPFEFWLGRGYPLDPYTRGRIVMLLRKEFAPKDLRVAPDELFAQGGHEGQGERYILEYTLLRGWMRQWLKYVHWYYSVAMCDETPIDVLFDGPVVTTHWKANRSEPTLIRFGLMWKIYDFVGQYRQAPLPLVLCAPTPEKKYLLGGYSGLDFLIKYLYTIVKRIVRIYTIVRIKTIYTTRFITTYYRICLFSFFFYIYMVLHGDMVDSSSCFVSSSKEYK